MLDQRRRLKCPATGVECPRDPCPGSEDLAVCRHWAALAALRSGPRPEPPRPDDEPPDPPGDPGREAGLARELIVARYNEDVSWVADSPVPVTVYNKGADDLDLPGRVRVVRLSNKGREGRTWLTHFTRNRATLAGLTFTAQGEPHQEPAEFLSRLRLDYPETTPLTSRYLPHFPPDWIKARDLVADRGGLAIRYGRAEHQGGRTLAENGRWLRESWSRFFEVPPPDPIRDWVYGYGAMYAIPRARVLGRSDEFWRWCWRVIALPENQAEHAWGSGYAFEVLWPYLLGDPGLWPAREPPVELDRLAELARTCPEGSGPCGCGASPRRCASRGDVWIKDCLACQRAKVEAARVAGG